MAARLAARHLRQGSLSDYVSLSQKDNQHSVPYLTPSAFEMFFLICRMHHEEVLKFQLERVMNSYINC